MNDREKQIIAQAISFLEELTNSHRLRERIHQAKEINTLDAFWELHTDLTHPNTLEPEKDYMKLLIRYRVGESNAISYARELAAILRGERLENK